MFWQADTNLEGLLELGYPQPEAPLASVLPPGGGGLVVPPFSTFSQVVNLISRSYRWTFDEALRHNQSNALALRRDPVIMDALRSRQMPVAQLEWHLQSEDDQDTRQAEAVKTLTRCIEATPNLQRFLMHLLEAIYFGRYAVQVAWKWDWREGKKLLKVRKYQPVNGDKLVFKYDDRVGILVHATYDGSWEPTERGRAHFLNQSEREQFILHRHEPEDADFFEGEMAGSINGVGIRSRIYWLWYLKQNVFGFLMDYLERVGAGGFTIYYYEMGNAQSEQEVRKQAEEQFRNNAILFPRYKDGSTGGPGVERIEPSLAGAQLLQSLVMTYFDDLLRHYILGQTLTTQAEATGMGSEVAGLHGDTFARIIKYDAINLAESLTSDFVAVFQRYLFPDVPPIKWVFDVDKPNAGEVLEASSAFYEMGGTVDEDELRSVIGLSKPQPGHSMLAKMPPLSPAAVGPVVPGGVPQEGVPGPDVTGQGQEAMQQGGGPPQMVQEGAEGNEPQ